MTMPAGPLLEVRDLTVSFRSARGWRPSRRQTISAVDGVSLSIASREVLSVVGESGCGKSTLARTIVRLETATSGRVLFEGDDLLRLSGRALRRRRRHIQMVFQDPFSSLSPRQTVETMLVEPMDVHGIGTPSDRRDRAVDLLGRVGLDPSALSRYAFQFSGGQRQRIAIARALAVEPRLLLCDEPISALDVSIRAQILNLLHDLRHTLGLSYLFIAHDLAAVRHVSDRVAVMYLGRIAEMAPAEELFAHPTHPYTRALWSAAPVPNPAIERRRRRIILRGELPNPAEPPSGCRFRTRCPIATDRCSAETPALREVSPGHAVACHHAERAVSEPALQISA